MSWEESSVLLDDDIGTNSLVHDIQHDLLENIKCGDKTSFLEAIKCNNESILIELLKDETNSLSKSMINYQDENMDSCLHWSVNNEDPNHSWIKFLLEKVLSIHF